MLIETIFGAIVDFAAILLLFIPAFIVFVLFYGFIRIIYMAFIDFNTRRKIKRADYKWPRKN